MRHRAQGTETRCVRPISGGTSVAAELSCSSAATLVSYWLEWRVTSAGAYDRSANFRDVGEREFA